MATLDTSFYAVQPRSVSDFNKEADGMQANRLALQLQGRQLANAERADKEDQQLRSIYQGLSAGASDADIVSQLRGAGFYKEAEAQQKASGERNQKQADADLKKAQAHKAQLEGAITKQAQIAQAAGTATDQASWERAIQLAASVGADVSKIPQVFDPVLAKQLSMQALKGTEQLEQVWKQKGYDLEVEKAGETKRHHRATEDRARETASQTLTKPFEVTGPDGLPMLVQQDKAGNLKRVEGFGPKAGSAKPLTEGQAKANMFGSRMEAANKILDDLARGDGKTPGTDMPSLTKRGAEAVPLIGGALGMAANAAASPAQQQVEQAQRDFINAVLRRESGAAIAESEFANAAQQYFPQPNDDKKTRAQKREARMRATELMLAEVPKGARPKPESAKDGGADGSWDGNPASLSDAVAAELARRNGGK